MKRLALLLAVIMVAAAFAFPSSADTGKKCVVLFDFDTTAPKSTAATKLDTENQIDGLGCYSYCTSDANDKNTPNIAAQFDAVDISDCDYLAFWLYLEDASLASKFNSGRVEITSSGTSGLKDIWYPICKQDNFPGCWLPDLIEGGAKAGWNLVRLPLNVTTGTPAAGQTKVNTNAADKTAISYFHIYGTNTVWNGKTIKIDTLFAYQEGAVIPEPHKGAPETQPPETDAPETKAPETDAPETQAPETKAPGTDAPETQVPGTDVPATQDPSTQPADDPYPFPFNAFAAIAIVAVAIIVVIFVISRKKH